MGHRPDWQGGSVQHATINISSATTTNIVAPVTGKSIVLLDYVIAVAGTNILTWRDTSGLLSGLMQLKPDGPVASGWADFGHLKTTSGEALRIVTTTAQVVGGHCSYVAV